MGTFVNYKRDTKQPNIPKRAILTIICLHYQPEPFLIGTDSGPSSIP